MSDNVIPIGGGDDNNDDVDVRPQIHTITFAKSHSTPDLESVTEEGHLVSIQEFMAIVPDIGKIPSVMVPRDLIRSIVSKEIEVVTLN